MQIDSVPTVLSTAMEPRSEERLVANLATGLQVHCVEKPGEAQDDTRFEFVRNEDEARVVWSGENRQTVYRVIDAQSGEIVQQVPSEEVLRVARKIEDFLISQNPDLDVQT